MRRELERLIVDLPAPLPAAPAQSKPVRAIGDVRRSGAWLVPAESHYRSVAGNVQLDLREARIGAADVRIDVRTLFGVIDLLVPEGIEVDAQARPRMGRIPSGAFAAGRPRRAAHRAHRRQRVRRDPRAPPPAVGEAGAPPDRALIRGTRSQRGPLDDEDCGLRGGSSARAGGPLSTPAMTARKLDAAFHARPAQAMSSAPTTSMSVAVVQWTPYAIVLGPPLRRTMMPSATGIDAKATISQPSSRGVPLMSRIAMTIADHDVPRGP